MDNVSAFSIKLFLADGTPDGLQLVEKSNWTGLAIVCSRQQYTRVRLRDEFQRAGVYVLTGPGESILPKAYVGEADVLRKRLDNHHQNNEFWTRVVAFTSKDGNINKAHVRYLEARLIGIAKQAKRSELANGTAPQPPVLSESETADVESFLRDMLLMYPILDVGAFEMSHVPTHVEDLRDLQTRKPHVIDTTLHLTGPCALATGVDAPEGFIVRGGSSGRAKGVPSMHRWLIELREGLIAQGILALEGEQLVVTQDYAFDSPSSAAGVLLGRSANGREEWKDSDGKTLKQLQSEALIAPP